MTPPPNTPNPDDARRSRIYQAIEEILRRLDLHKPTGRIYLQLDVKQGGITAMKIGGEENFRD